MDPLLRFGALSAALAGLLRLTAQAIPYVPGSPRLEALYAAVDLCFLFALTALIAALAGRTGRLTLALLLAALGGVASIVGPDAKQFGIDFYLAGSALFTLALGGAALDLVRRPGLRAASLLWTVAALAGAASAWGGGSAAFAVAGLALAAGFVMLAPWLWGEGRKVGTQGR